MSPRVRRFLLLLITYVAIDMGAPALPGPFTLDLQEEPEVVHLRGARVHEPDAAAQRDAGPAGKTQDVRPSIRTVRRASARLPRPEWSTPTARAYAFEVPLAPPSEDH